MIQIHAGEIVELVIRKKNINISELARKMNVNRRTMYNWFLVPDLSSSIIYAISHAMNYDFSPDFPANFFDMKFSTPQMISDTGNGDHKLESPYYWMKKYITLLEDYKLLLEEIKLKQPHLYESFMRSG